MLDDNSFVGDKKFLIIIIYVVHNRRDPLGITFQMTCISFTTLAGGQFNNAYLGRLKFLKDLRILNLHLLFVCFNGCLTRGRKVGILS